MLYYFVVYILGAVSTFMLLVEEEPVGYAIGCALIWPVFAVITIVMFMRGN